jgi:hypothetical protein
MFESGAIVLHIAERSPALMPDDGHERERVRTWMLAALNSVEPPIMMLNFIDLQPGGVADGAKPLRDTIAGWIGMRLDNLAKFLGDREHLVADRFTAADLLMTTVLRILRNTDLVAQRPTLDAYKKRNEERPAFVKALAAQLTTFAKHAPPNPTSSRGAPRASAMLLARPGPGSAVGLRALHAPRSLEALAVGAEGEDERAAVAGPDPVAGEDVAGKGALDLAFVGAGIGPR